jgi:hypothetical protein
LNRPSSWFLLLVTPTETGLAIDKILKVFIAPSPAPADGWLESGAVLVRLAKGWRWLHAVVVFLQMQQHTGIDRVFFSVPVHELVLGHG